MEEIEIRIANIEDTKAILDIYAYYVNHTAITFEYEVPSLDEFKQRIQNTLKRYPYLIAKKGKQIVGYAYVSPFKERAAYDWAVETSIYVDCNYKRQGIGKKLYQALELILKEQGILNLNACIAYPIVEDQYLNKNSVQYHQHLGYKLVGEFHQCGYKFNTWYNMVWMEKTIGKHFNKQPPIKAFHEVKDTIKTKYQIF